MFTIRSQFVQHNIGLRVSCQILEKFTRILTDMFTIRSQFVQHNNYFEKFIYQNVGQYMSTIRSWFVQHNL